MDNKINTFLFHNKWEYIFKELPREKSYDLLIHLLDYVNGRKPYTEDILIKIAFHYIKNDIIDDNEDLNEQDKINRTTFLLHTNLLYKVNSLTDEQAGKFIKAVFQFASGERFDIDPELEKLFRQVVTRILNDWERYETECKKKSKSALDRAIEYHEKYPEREIKPTQ